MNWIPATHQLANLNAQMVANAANELKLGHYQIILRIHA